MASKNVVTGERRMPTRSAPISSVTAATNSRANLGTQEGRESDDAVDSWRGSSQFVPYT